MLKILADNGYVITVRCEACGEVSTVPRTSFAAANAKHARCSRYFRLGDAIAAATSKIGIKPCAPCKKRQEALNNLIPRRLKW